MSAQQPLAQIIKGLIENPEKLDCQLSPEIQEKLRLAVEESETQPSMTGNAGQAGPPDKFLTVYQVCDMTGYSRRSLLRMIQHGKFPDPIRLNARRNVWRLSLVQEWMDAQASTVTPEEQAGHLSAGKTA